MVCSSEREHICWSGSVRSAVSISSEARKTCIIFSCVAHLVRVRGRLRGRLRVRVRVRVRVSDHRSGEGEG